ALWLQPLLLVPLVAELFLASEGKTLVLIPFHLAAFFVTALVCHQTLVQSRPAAERSTDFYLWIALGGALGGLFNVFLAPTLVRPVVEYPLGLTAAALLRPGGAEAPDSRARRLDLALPIGLLAVLLAGVAALRAAAAHLDELPARLGLAALMSFAGVAA